MPFFTFLTSKTTLIRHVEPRKLVCTCIGMRLVCGKKTMKIETFLGTQNMKKTVFSRTSKFIFTLLRPNSWCKRVKFLLNNGKNGHLLYARFYENRSTLRLNNGVPNSEKLFLKCKISTFGWVHLKTTRGQQKTPHEHLTRVHFT